MMEDCILDNLLSGLATEARELYLDSNVQELDAVPSSLTFLRDYVSLNKPVVIRGAVNHWPAVGRWTSDYLRQKIGDKEITVAVTPNGYADAVTTMSNGTRCFMLPEERLMHFNQFLDILHQFDFCAADRKQTADCSTKKVISCEHCNNVNNCCNDSENNDERISENSRVEVLHCGSLYSISGCDGFTDHCGEAGVFYVQKQNSNLSEEFPELQVDVMRLTWAEEAFDKSPDAVNFWMGDKRAITSMHKDHYENIYCVVSGTKTFTLIPPTDQPFLPYEEFPVARYKQNAESKEFDIIEDSSIGKVPWIPVDVLRPDLDLYPQFSEARPITVTVQAGDVLYLPSLWYHHVQQSHACIAVNYWYDMNFDIKYCYYKFIESLLTERRKQKSEYHKLNTNSAVTL